MWRLDMNICILKFLNFSGGCGDAGTEANGHPGSGTEGQAPPRG